ncbi:hypothetical protein AX774_g7575 [Zancudomyces culisetae]|uniref:Uncharacterized protein n=1 Tax=Zancudomyces culisetae TaxID=1213189 RepID=A0A1R1PDP2_ZANCU|nr:hypothetical protein AX774_g7575 [Zancudomyces culisetae]|eukprot:OMH79023.1 hypothetical protein AX774_g7575 [Zancudomyces culisetae]
MLKTLKRPLCVSRHFSNIQKNTYSANFGTAAVQLTGVNRFFSKNVNTDSSLVNPKHNSFGISFNTKLEKRWFTQYTSRNSENDGQSSQKSVEDGQQTFGTEQEKVIYDKLKEALKPQVLKVIDLSG